MKEESKKRIKLNKIKSIGGKLLSTYERLQEELIEVDKCAFTLWEPFADILDIDIPDYLKIVEKGESVILPLYQEFKFNEYLRDLEDGKPVKKYNSEKSAHRGIFMKAKKDFEEIVDEARRREYRSSRLPWKHPVTDFFVNCLFLDPEDGLLIDGEKYINKYNSITEAEQTEKHARHIKAVDALNDFFKGNNITWKLFDKFFVIEDGKFAVNPDNVNKKGYMNIVG